VALAVFMIIFGAAMSGTSRLMSFAEATDINMLVTTENQRAIREMKMDIYCSSKNTVGPFAPAAVGNELRFRVVTGFDQSTGLSTYSGYQVCYWQDPDRSLLVRFFRDANNNKLTDPPVEYPAGAEQVICQYCTGFNFGVEPNCGMVTVILTNSIGNPTSPEFATCSTQFDIMPFNYR
jgi:hypothetical protein